MLAKTITELKEEISLLPDQYKQALERQTRAYLEIFKLENEISKVKKSLLSDKDDSGTGVFDEDEDATLLDLQSKFDLLKYELTTTEYKVEINVRDGERKLNERHVIALIGTEDEVCRLRKQVLSDEAKIKAKKSELRKLSREHREKDRISSRRPRITPESQELDDLEAKLFMATSEQTLATDEVDAIKFRFEAYRVLYGLESLEEIE